MSSEKRGGGGGEERGGRRVVRMAKSERDGGEGGREASGAVSSRTVGVRRSVRVRCVCQGGVCAWKKSQ
eukprot:1215096-Rhodomonas_salina.1